MHIDYADLRRLCPGGDPAIMGEIARLAPELLPGAGITTHLRWCHFIAQAAAETGGLARLEENLSYSAERIVQVWPSRFASVAAARPFARNPEALANEVYGGRMGNSRPGDGWLYRGRGMKQLTGRANYTGAAAATGLPLVERPELAAFFPATMRIACWYWDSRRLNRHADADDLEMVTRGVNGGLIGLADRWAYLSRAKTIWGTVAPGVAEPGPAVRRTLRPDATGGDVVTLQRALNRLMPGRTALREDGAFGQETKGAVIAWQGEQGLKADGICGPDTWASIDAALAAGRSPDVAPPPIEIPPAPPPDLPDPVEPHEPAPQGGFFRALLRRIFQ